MQANYKKKTAATTARPPCLCGIPAKTVYYIQARPSVPTMPDRAQRANSHFPIAARNPEVTAGGFPFTEPSVAGRSVEVV